MATMRIVMIALLLGAIWGQTVAGAATADADANAVTVITGKPSPDDKAGESETANKPAKERWRRFLLGAEQPARPSLTEPPQEVEPEAPRLPEPKQATVVAALPAQLKASSIKADKAVADASPDASALARKEEPGLLLATDITAPEASCVAHNIAFADEEAVSEVSGVLPAPESEVPAEGFVDPDAEFTANETEDPLDEQLTAAGVGTAVISPWRSVAASFFVLGLVFLLYGIVRLFKPRKLFKVDSDFEILREFTVSPGRRIALARVLNRVYLLGLNKDGVSLIDRVEDFGEGGAVSPFTASVHHRERVAAASHADGTRRPVAERPPKSVAEKTLGAATTYSPYRNRVNDSGGSRRHAASAEVAREGRNWFPRRSTRPGPRGRLYLSQDENGGRKDYLLSKLKGEIERLT